VIYLPVNREGLLKLADLEGAITNQTAFASLMWANNQTGQGDHKGRPYCLRADG
jgi:cysteine desulfurase